MNSFKIHIACPTCKASCRVLHLGKRAGKLQCVACKWVGSLAQASK